MNTGIIASRYASALLLLVDETGGGEAVVSQVILLEKALAEVPELKRAVDDSTSVSPAQKLTLFEAALGSGFPAADENPVKAAEAPSPDPGKGRLAPELRKFIELLVRNGRIGDAALIFRNFVSEYDRSRGIVRGRMTIPVAPLEGEASELEAKLGALVESRTGRRLILTRTVDPSIIGGFVLEFEDQMLDASVAHQLEIIRRQFERANRRIV